MCVRVCVCVVYVYTQIDNISICGRWQRWDIVYCTLCVGCWLYGVLWIVDGKDAADSINEWQWQNSFALFAMWWLNLLCSLSCQAFSCPLNFILISFPIPKMAFYWMCTHTHCPLSPICQDHRSNRMVESQSVLIKRIKYSLDFLGHKLIIHCSASWQSRKNEYLQYKCTYYVYIRGRGVMQRRNRVYIQYMYYIDWKWRIFDESTKR